MTMAENAAIHIPDATAEPNAYRDALLAVLGEQDPLDIIAQTPRRVRELTEGRAATELERPPAGGGWSAADIIGHLLDGEIALGFRWRLILTADRPAYPAYDEKLWAALPKPPVEQRLQAWDGLRAYNLWLLRSIPGADWSRIGVHSEQGPLPLEVTVRAVAGHDLAHLDQLERALSG
jgi:hypothetical protein